MASVDSPCIYSVCVGGVGDWVRLYCAMQNEIKMGADVCMFVSHNYDVIVCNSSYTKTQTQTKMYTNSQKVLLYTRNTLKRKRLRECVRESVCVCVRECVCV